MDTIKIGNYLKELRMQKAMTQAELAEIIGVSNRSVSRWETGASLPDLSILVWLAEYYEVEIADLIKGKDEEEFTMENNNETIKKIVEYTEEEKKQLREFFAILFGIGIVVSIISYVLLTSFEVRPGWMDFIIGIGHGISFGCLILGLLMATGWVDKFAYLTRKIEQLEAKKKKKEKEKEINQ